MNNTATILVVDDTTETLALLVNILGAAGHQVRPADSGELALAAIAVQPPDLILLDIHMKGMDGLEVCRQLKAKQETRNIPIILISAFTDIEERVMGFHLGAVDYISKPFQTEELLARVKAHLSLSLASVSLAQQADELRRNLDLAECSRRAMLSTMEDQKQAEKARRESEEMFRSLFQSSHDALMTLEPPSWAFTSGNPETQKMFKVKSEMEFMTFTPGDLSPEIQPDGRASTEKAGEMIDTALREGSHFFEWVHKRTNGEEFPATVLFTRVTLAGRSFLQATVRDVARVKLAEQEKIKLEDQLRQSQKLEAIGQLASGVAHDFNNLLGGIMGHAELLKMKLDAGSDLRRHADRIFTACTKAAGLTRQLLSFARKAPIQIMDVDMNSVIKQVVEIVERTIDRRIEISIQLQDQLPVVSGDANQLENALLNIAINARDAMPEGGRLNISSKSVDLDRSSLPDQTGAMTAGAYIMVSIADTGTGIRKENLEHIFDPFFTTKEIGKGTGLGLASVYGCIIQHNGYINVQSQEGEGTRFDIYLPVAKTDGSLDDETKETTLVSGSGTLLVVDDEPVFHEIITETFGNLGYTVYNCFNGPDAVAFYRDHQHEIDVVILDMNMPKMSGLECFRSLKKVNADVKVIVASGYGENSDQEKMWTEGIRAFVQKPYKATELGRMIAELMGSNGL